MAPLPPSALYISVPIEVLLLAFHISVAFFIGRQVVKRNVFFSSAFYIIYLMQSVAEFWLYLQTLLMTRIVLPYKLVSREVLEDGSIARAHSFLLGFLVIFHFTAHLFSALNRMTALVFPTRYAIIWRAKPLRIWLSLLVVVPACFASLRLSPTFLNTDDSNGYSFAYYADWVGPVSP
ncbi:hypothetical protein AAVH_23476 [Aphelenchoides avenae]|nr:hypothetical protein AAVH_23476 [Aphelenchus avenae]